MKKIEFREEVWDEKWDDLFVSKFVLCEDSEVKNVLEKVKERLKSDPTIEYVGTHRQFSNVSRQNEVLYYTRDGNEGTVHVLDYEEPLKITLENCLEIDLFPKHDDQELFELEEDDFDDDFDDD